MSEPRDPFLAREDPVRDVERQHRHRHARAAPEHRLGRMRIGTAAHDEQLRAEGRVQERFRGVQEHDIRTDRHSRVLLLPRPQGVGELQDLLILPGGAVLLGHGPTVRGAGGGAFWCQLVFDGAGCPNTGRR